MAVSDHFPNNWRHFQLVHQLSSAEVPIHNLNGTATKTNVRSNRFFFFDAPGTARKSFETTTVQIFLQSRAKCLLAVASSAAGMQLLYGCNTAHSALKILIPVTSDFTFNIDANFHLGRDLCVSYLINWDKAVMSVVTAWKQWIAHFAACPELLDHFEEL